MLRSVALPGCFLARMATLKAIHRHDAREFNADAKEHHWGKPKLKGDQ
jgi:hypothetical protein